MTDAPRPLILWPVEKTNTPTLGWQDVNLPDEQEWVQTYTDLFGPHGQAVHPERAARLAAYGWTPEDLRIVCASPHNITAMHPPETATELQAAALAALTDEATAFFLLGVAASTDRRQGYAAHLSETYRWSPDETLTVLGIDGGEVEPFSAVAGHMRADMPSLIMGPGSVADTLRSSLEDRRRSDWLTPKSQEGIADDSERLPTVEAPAAIKPVYSFPERAPYVSPSRGEGGIPPRTRPGVWDVEFMEDNSAWADVFASLFPLRGSTHARRAERLSAYGWKPKDLVEACTHPKTVEVIQRHFEHPHAEEAEEAMVALFQEVTLFHQQAYAASHSRRDAAAARLSHDHGWTVGEVGSLMRLRPGNSGQSPDVVWEDVDDNSAWDRAEQADIRDRVEWEDRMYPWEQLKREA